MGQNGSHYNDGSHGPWVTFAVDNFLAQTWRATTTSGNMQLVTDLQSNTTITSTWTWLSCTNVWTRWLRRSSSRRCRDRNLRQPHPPCPSPHLSAGDASFSGHHLSSVDWPNPSCHKKKKTKLTMMTMIHLFIHLLKHRNENNNTTAVNERKTTMPAFYISRL